jgi:hypothetical protein
MQRTLKRESKVLEIVKRETVGAQRIASRTFHGGEGFKTPPRRRLEATSSERQRGPGGRRERSPRRGRRASSGTFLRGRARIRRPGGSASVEKGEKGVRRGCRGRERSFPRPYSSGRNTQSVRSTEEKPIGSALPQGRESFPPRGGAHLSAR